MRNKLFILASVVLAVIGAGCAGPEQKIGRGIGNFTEFTRAGEFERGIEQGALFDGTDTGLASGLVRGIDHTVARTGIGLYEIITFPIPPYGPVCTDYVTPKPMYPDAYKPRKWADPTFDSDRLIGFSGGDVAPWFPGSRFTVFDN